jgi:hypothetical protein
MPVPRNWGLSVKGIELEDDLGKLIKEFGMISIVWNSCFSSVAIPMHVLIVPLCSVL